MIKIKFYLWLKKVFWPSILVEVVYNFVEIWRFFPDDEKDKTCWFIWVSDKKYWSDTWAWNVKNLLVEITPTLICIIGLMMTMDKKFEQRRKKYFNIFRLFIIYGVIEYFYYFANHKTDYYLTIYPLIIIIQSVLNRKELKHGNNRN